MKGKEGEPGVENENEDVSMGRCYSKEMEPVEGLPNTNPVLGIDAPEKAKENGRKYKRPLST